METTSPPAEPRPRRARLAGRPLPGRASPAAEPRARGPWPALAAAGLLLLLTACGGAARPGEVTVQPPDPGPDSLPSEARGLPRATLDSVPPPRPERPWLPLGIQWSPGRPHEGEAVGVHLYQPSAGRRPAAVEGEMDGRPVRFTPVEGGWFGVAAAPIGSAGPARLVLRYRLSPDSTVSQSVRLPIAEREFPATRLSVAPRYSEPSPEALVRIREERELITATLARATGEWLPRDGFTWPREKRITSPFGQRRVFNEELKSRHTGLDLRGREGDPVHASARGRVALAGDFYYAGSAVYLDHGLGVYTAYFHLSRIAVAEGDTVRQGEPMGEVGATGRVTGPHLHWSLYVNGEALDAASLLLLRPPR